MALEGELTRLRQSCSELVPDSRLITCTSSHVRVQISRTRFQTLVVVLHFQAGYPASAPLLVELSSKTLSEDFTKRLAQLCDQQVGKNLSQPQVVSTLRFIAQFLDEHPLCSCWEEVSRLRASLLQPSDRLKLHQKDSSISLSLIEGQYVHKVLVAVPKEYPDCPVVTQLKSSNLSPMIQKYLAGQCREIARTCVEPPLNQKRASVLSDAWEKRPSLQPVLQFLAEMIHSLPNQECPVCKSRCFPQNPEDVVTDEQDERHVERVYCGHMFHLGCLLGYMKSPPFTGGQKHCPACSQPIYHEKYKVPPRLTEARWAYKEARQQELEEVADFLQ